MNKDKNRLHPAYNNYIQFTKNIIIMNMYINIKNTKSHDDLV